MTIPTSRLLTAGSSDAVPTGWEILQQLSEPPTLVSAAAEGSASSAFRFLQVEPAPWLRRGARSLRRPGGRARASQATSFPLPPLLCGPLHIPTNRVRRKGNRARLADGCQVSLKSWLNKGKQITKMEIFKPAFSGIQIDVWVARRHRPHSCYFVIKMIRKIPPCWGFLLPKRLVSFPLRISPFFGERQPPDHSRTANIRWNLASADFFFFSSEELNLKKNACTSQSGEIQIKKKFLGTFPGSSAFCIRNSEFCDRAWIVFPFHLDAIPEYESCQKHMLPCSPLRLNGVLCLIL